MSDAIIHTVGEFTGTCQEGAAITKIASANFGRRLEKFYDGAYSVEQVLNVGSLSRVRTADSGNDEWDTLSRHEEDARLDMKDVPFNWLRNKSR
jgi:hypothetical protein